MDLRVIVVAGDQGLAEMLRTQVENLGCTSNPARDIDEALGHLGWADAAVVDLAGDGVDHLRRLRTAAPELQVLAIAEEEAQAEHGRKLGADVLVEPLSIPALVQAVRQLGARAGGAGDGVIDLDAAAEVDDAPWWATR